MAHLATMMRALQFFAFTFVFVLFSSALHAQGSGTVAGRVVDAKSGESLIGVAVIVEGPGIGTTTDLDGRFSFKLKPGTYIVTAKYVGYTPKSVQNVVVEAGKLVTLNISLGDSKKQIKEVTVSSEMKKESANTLLMQQKNAAVMSDGLSIEAIRRTPDRNTGDVLKRVSGASIQDGKYAVIRGLPDRYNAAYLNGSPLPSSEPDRRAFAFDIFPAALLDNLTIIKTATPDQNAEFAGGNIQIKTRDIPDENYVNLSIGSSYNTLTTFRPFYRSIVGSTDFLGIDDGARQLPGNFPDSKQLNAIQNNLSNPNRVAELTNLGRSMNNNFGLTRFESIMPATNFQLAMGQKFKLNERYELGSVFALSHNLTPNYQEVERLDYNDEQNALFRFRDRQYNFNTLWGGIWNLALKSGQNHKYSLKTLYNVNTTDQTVLRDGQDIINGTDIQSSALWYTQNNLFSTQFQGDHFFKSHKLKLNYGLGLSQLSRTTPDLRRIRYQRSSEDTTQAYSVAISNTAQPDIAGRFYSDQQDLIYSAFADVEKPYEKWKTTLKAGVYFQQKNRDFQARQIGYVWGGIFANQALASLTQDKIFAAQNLGSNGFIVNEATTPSDAYRAGSTLYATYLRAESKPVEKLRLIYGVRFESYQQTLNTFKPGIQQAFDTSFVVNDLLPSLNAVWALSDKTNLRFAYSQTLSRPEFRELAPFQFFDFNDFLLVEGSSLLRRTKIHNLDLRYEWYFKPGQLVSATVFYKHFNDPIEKYLLPTGSLRLMSYQNVPSASTVGLEFDFRVSVASMTNSKRKFLENISLIGNVSFIHSRVDVSGLIGSGSADRPMQGQSPFLLNGGIQFNDPEKQIGFSVMVNRVGRRIAAIGNAEYPEFWENPRTVLDLQLSKVFFKHLEVRLNVRDLLAQNLVYYQDLDKDGKLDRAKDNVMWDFALGATYGLTLGYRF